MPLRVLVVDDSEDDAELLVRELRRGGYDPRFERVETADAMAAALAEQEWDVVIGDYAMPHFSGLAALELLKKSRLDLPFILVSGVIGEDRAVQAMKAGAHDCVMKGNLSRLAPAVGRELREVAVRRERSLAEESLRRSEERYRTLADFTYDWEHWLGPDGKYLYVSPSCERITGYIPDEFIADPKMVDRIVHPDDRGRVAMHFDHEAMEDARRPHDLDFRIITRGGEARWIHHRCQSVYGEDGRWLGRRGSNRDITERKRAEQALRESEERFRRVFDERVPPHATVVTLPSPERVGWIGGMGASK